jgi:hypothetical protein
MYTPFEKNLLKIPEDLINIIGSQLPQITLKEVVQVSKSGYNLFQPDHLLGSLLWYVAAGEQDKAQEILKNYPKLLSKRGTVTDYSGRTFSNITAWELMRWYGDTRHMGNMLLDCLSQDEKGEKIRLRLVAQDEQFDKLGVAYTLKGTNFRDWSFNYSPLIDAYRELCNQALSASERIECWCTKVGGEQRYLPAHVANHYCDLATPFPKPKFDEKTLERTLSFYNLLTGDNELWWYKDPSKINLLGTNFGIGLRAGECRPAGAQACSQLGFSVHEDLAAILTLSERRATTDLESLNLRLKTPLLKMEWCVIP